VQDGGVGLHALEDGETVHMSGVRLYTWAIKHGGEVNEVGSNPEQTAATRTQAARSTHTTRRAAALQPPALGLFESTVLPSSVGPSG
jgi:hypothetical protein